MWMNLGCGCLQAHLTEAFKLVKNGTCLILWSVTLTDSEQVNKWWSNKMASIDQQFLRDSPVIATGLLSVWCVNNQILNKHQYKSPLAYIFNSPAYIWKRPSLRISSKRHVRFLDFYTKPQQSSSYPGYTEIYFLPETLSSIRIWGNEMFCRHIFCSSWRAVINFRFLFSFLSRQTLSRATRVTRK
jgi:hypothetical protein